MGGRHGTEPDGVPACEANIARTEFSTKCGPSLTRVLHDRQRARAQDSRLGLGFLFGLGQASRLGREHQVLGRRTAVGGRPRAPSTLNTERIHRRPRAEITTGNPSHGGADSLSIIFVGRPGLFGLRYWTVRVASAGGPHRHLGGTFGVDAVQETAVLDVTKRGAIAVVERQASGRRWPQRGAAVLLGQEPGLESVVLLDIQGGLGARRNGGVPTGRTEATGGHGDAPWNRRSPW